MSLFDDYQMMRKANKAALGKYLKKLNDLTLTTSSSKSPLIIDDGWLLHQPSSFNGCDTFDNVAQKYLKLIPKNRHVSVTFDGYQNSTKDHEHSRRAKDCCSDMTITKSTTCTVTKKKLLVNKITRKNSSIFCLMSSLNIVLQFLEQLTMQIQ